MQTLGRRQEPTREQAFICNLDQHWFTIRRVGDVWWNLNSMLPVGRCKLNPRA